MEERRVFLLLLFSGLAMADGMPFTPDPSVYFSLSEEHQIAIITIQEDMKANVDLFISIGDHSGQSHEIQFILPFYETPDSFGLKEMDLDDFEYEKTGPLDDFLIQYQEEDLRDAFLGAGGIFLFPYVLPFATFGVYRMSASADAISPIMTIESEHAKVEVYNVTDQQDLSSILSGYDINESFKSEYMRYVGKYMYMVTLNTVPVSEDKTAGSGVLFSFTSPMVQEEDTFTYTYPLGTGSAWAMPIKLTRIYVKGPRYIVEKVNYPDYGSWIGDPYEVMEFLLEGRRDTGFNYERVDNGFEEIRRILYFNANPDREITVSAVRPSITSQIYWNVFFAIFALRHFLFTGFFAVIWTIAFFFFVWSKVSRKTDFKKAFTQRSFYIKSLAYFAIYELSAIAAAIIPIIGPIFVPAYICKEVAPKIEKEKELPGLYGRFFMSGLLSLVVFYMFLSWLHSMMP